MPQAAFLITWREIIEAQPSIQGLRKHLAGYRLSSVLLGLARIAAQLKTWQNAIDFATDQRLAQQLLPTYFPAIKRRYEANRNRVVFTRVGLLFVAKQACVASEPQGHEVRSAQDVERILSCCLMANDLLLGRQPTPTDATIDNAASLLPFANYVPQDQYPTELARSLVLFEEIAPLLRERSDFIAMNEAFREATGLDVRAFCELAFSASVKFITNVDEQLRNPGSALVLTREYFRHTAVPQDQVMAFLNRSAISEDRLHALARRQDSLGGDFLIFQRYPLVEFSAGSFVCPDPGFLLNKAGRSLYWTLHDAQPSTQRHQLLTYWSAIIERYVHWLFEQTYQGRGQVTCSPRFSNGDEAFDALVVEGSSLIVIEIKASILTAQAKYGFNPNRLREELRRKTITGEDGERKGVAQLYAHLTRFLRGDDLPGIDRNAVRKIHPVLMFLDDSFTAPYLNLLYNEHFDRATLHYRYRRIFTPVFSLTIDDLENVLPHTHRHRLASILDSYWHENRNMHGMLSRSRVPLLQGQSPGKDIVRERFARFANELQHRFFPNQRQTTQD